MATTDAPPTVSKLPLFIMGAVVALAALVTVGLLAVRSNETYDPGTPEAALQDFLQAAFDEDSEAMLGLLTESTRAECDNFVDELRFDDFGADDLRAELEDMSVSGTSATAEVRFHQTGSNDPFNGSGWSFDERFILERVDGDWLVAKAGWPWPFAECTGVRS